MVVFWSYFITALAFTCQSLALDHFNILLNRSVELVGFHRNLEFSLTVESRSRLVTENCFIKIEQYLPKDAYMDPFQILHYTDQIYFPSEIDIENPAHHSNPMQSHIYFNISRLLNSEVVQYELTLPLHLRYQPPKTSEVEDVQVQIEIPSPAIFFRCSEPVSIFSCRAPVKDLCHHKNHSMCMWCQLGVQDTTPLHVTAVPRGDMRHLDFVFHVTLATIISGFLYILVKLFK